jgi:chemosensory pili system protein ChpA (sensor histidine kinase/response regulator)
MLQDKELEIRLQFLDEAQEYLSTMESALLGVADNQVDMPKLDAALRAAHSIKGGAATMGFQTLSELAHRLEDFFKVLKVQHNSIQIHAELERLLLLGVDCLHQVIDYERRGTPINQKWLDTKVYPILEQLRQRLGEPPEDTGLIMAPEEGQDVVHLLFETEVEGCLQRLESVLAENNPCLREEVEILAQELGGLGEMLDLMAFSQLCQSVEQHLNAAPDRVEEVSHLALQAWRRSQALVLTGNLNALPIGIEGTGLTTSASEAIIHSSSGTPETIEVEQPHLQENLADDRTFHAELIEDFDAAIPIETEESSPSQVDTLFSNTISDLEIMSFEDVQSASKEPQDTPRETNVTEFRVLEDPPADTTESSQESTVRVSAKQLDQLNALFGELTIERNRLNLGVKRLRNLIHSLNHRIQVLGQSNGQLRTAYDKVATQTTPDFWLSSADFGLEGSSKKLNQIRTNAYALNPTGTGQQPTTKIPKPELRGFDALEMDRYDDLHSVFQEVIETIVQVQEVTSDIDLGLEDTEETTHDLNKTAKQLQTSLTQLRMRPLSDVLDRFPRALRELSLQYGKSVQLKIHGGNTLVDRYILEALQAPLMHILRNAFDHGIETREIREACGKPEQGVIEIRAFHQSNWTVITIGDDGGGIPLEKIRAQAIQQGLDKMLLERASDEDLLSLIFEPGFSTADQVTTLSGRGIGMDVVRNNLEQVRGKIKVDTQAGVGTTFTILVPCTLSVMRVLLAESNGMLLAFPTDLIEEMFFLQPEQIIKTIGSEAFEWEGRMVQLIRLSQWLTFNISRPSSGLETPPSIDVPTTLMLRQNNHPVGLQVDRCWGEQEVAIRRIEGNLPMPPGFSNCTILGDGRVVPLVNVPELLQWINGDKLARINPDASLPHLLSTSETPPELNLPKPTTQPNPKLTILIVDDSITVRRLLALVLEKAGYQVIQAKDGQDALDQLSGGLQVQTAICDIEMPRLDGYGFLAQVKSIAHLKQLPVIMLTSRSGDKHRQLAMNLGAIAYFSKPYNEQKLLQTLEQVLNVAPAIGSSNGL